MMRRSPRIDASLPSTCPGTASRFLRNGFATAEYLLTTDAYIETVLAFCNSLHLERPLLVGCSMGGRIALQLAALHADRFGGFIAIEASDFQPAGTT